MTLKQIKQVIKGERKLIDVYYYIQGKIRYTLFYSRLKELLPEHIRSQITYRIAVMNPLCRSQGSCIKCGCETTALQMCNKACEGNCYPKMMEARNWYCKSSVPVDKESIWLYNPRKQMYELFKIQGKEYVKIN